jgi:hypothetical protein
MRLQHHCTVLHHSRPKARQLYIAGLTSAAMHLRITRVLNEACMYSRLQPPQFSTGKVETSNKVTYRQQTTALCWPAAATGSE